MVWHFSEIYVIGRKRGSLPSQAPADGPCGWPSLFAVALGDRFLGSPLYLYDSIGRCIFQYGMLDKKTGHFSCNRENSIFFPFLSLTVLSML